MDHVIENLGCSLDCGAPNPDLCFATKNLAFSQELLVPMFSDRKYVIDYAFNQSYVFNELEQLVQFSEFYFITREDIATLNPGQQIMTSVIDGWCLLLNHIMKPSDISRSFFGLSHTSPAIMIWDAQKLGKVLNKDEDIYGGWDSWAEMCRAPFQLDTDMIFLPVLSGDGDHYSCVCINFLTEQIDYLDNRKYDDPIETLPYGGIARISANIMGKYLVSKGLSKGAKVSGFKIVNIEFSWQGQGYSRNDCGVFMMLHMMFYRGSPFQCDLGKEDAMSLYRLEILSQHSSLVTLMMIEKIS
ncbi:uncharacterized protein LOC141588164 [Silene latifolia]|uniref:uncharacterized protein LOC141588164 n=1 Tax=Silene latifolia TaxID=37657 RepID=UPI003D76B9B8